MQIVNQLKLKLDKFEKCAVLCDNDCSLGVLYDYSCALQGFLIQKMKEAQEQNKSVKQPDIQPEVIEV